MTESSLLTELISVVVSEDQDDDEVSILDIIKATGKNYHYISRRLKPLVEKGLLGVRKGKGKDGRVKKLYKKTPAGKNVDLSKMLAT